MLASQRLHAIALLGVILFGATGGSASALPGSAPAAASGPTLLQQIARKGTRSYVPDHIPEDTTDTKTSEAKALADCIEIWDEKTHISKSKWREICKRQLKERGALLSAP